MVHDEVLVEPTEPKYVGTWVEKSGETLHRFFAFVPLLIGFGLVSRPIKRGRPKYTSGTIIKVPDWMDPEIHYDQVPRETIPPAALKALQAVEDGVVKNALETSHVSFKNYQHPDYASSIKKALGKYKDLIGNLQIKIDPYVPPGQIWFTDPQPGVPLPIKSFDNIKFPEITPEVMLKQWEGIKPSFDEKYKGWGTVKFPKTEKDMSVAPTDVKPWKDLPSNEFDAKKWKKLAFPDLPKFSKIEPTFIKPMPISPSYAEHYEYLAQKLFESTGIPASCFGDVPKKGDSGEDK